MDSQKIKKIFFRQNGILAWIVCFGMLISNIIVQGLNNSFGEIISTTTIEFNSDLTSVALIPSIHSAAYYFAGFICSILVKWYSFRSLVFLGGVASSIAFLASFYATSITSLTISILIYRTPWFYAEIWMMSFFLKSTYWRVKNEQTAEI